MPLSTGDKLGPYEILSLLGKGGMGEVYKAHDPRLRRDVAIKVSSAQFSERFAREARAIASLNHPNICTLFDIGPNYLVMEFIEGPTLQDRIKDGVVPVEEALHIARQMAAALEAAHEKPIIHRDLKPANVKLTATGIVKVLDFGLAKVAEPTEPLGEDSPTLTLASATVAGTVLGTAAYMAPEQARGKTVDKRADIWAFGVVVYELLTGGRLFHGETLADTLIDVATKQPEWEKVPPRALRLLQRCLEKDPQKRLRDIGDFGLLLEEAPAAAAPASVAPAAKRSRWPWAVAALGLAAAGVALWAPWRKTPEPPAVVFDIYPPKGEVFVLNHPSISPDGSMVALGVSKNGVRRIVVRSLNSGELRDLPGTEGASYPDWSPDSRSLTFSAGGKLKRIEVAGGPPQTLSDWNAPSVPFSAWGAGAGGAGVILTPSPTSELVAVPGSGGTPVKVTAFDKGRGETRHGIPQFLPDGKRFLFHARTRKPEEQGLYASSLTDLAAGKKPAFVMQSEAVPFYAQAADGGEYILFQREDALMGQAFDSGSLQLAGEPFVVLSSVGTNADHPYITASRTGALVYGAGLGSSAGLGGIYQLRWRDRAGKLLRNAGTPSRIASFSLSPDETRVALTMVAANRDVYLMDLSPNGTPTRFTFAPENDIFPLWSQNGRRIVFGRNDSIFEKAVDATATEQELVQSKGQPQSWSPDGRLLHGTGSLLVAANGKVETFADTSNLLKHGQFSPDGKWIVYTSEESGRTEVWLQPYPANGAKFQITQSGGTFPRWRTDGKELFFVNTQAQLTALPITLGASPQWGTPVPLFPVPVTGTNAAFWPYAVNKDGQKFLVMEELESAETQPVTVVTNWLANARRAAKQ